MSTIVKSLRFTRKVTVKNRKALIEKLNVHEKRLSFLRKIVLYRRVGRKFIFMEPAVILLTPNEKVALFQVLLWYRNKA
jgi:hypothetical protein